MTQNTRTRDEQVANAVKFAHLQPQAIGEFLGCYLDPMLREAEARGAEEQRRKDRENTQGGEVVYLRYADYEGWCFCTKEEYETVEEDEDKRILYTRPANVPALEAEIAELKEAEQLARADAEASKANAENLKKVALDVLQVCQRSKMGPSDLGYVTNMIRAALTREGGV